MRTSTPTLLALAIITGCGSSPEPVTEPTTELDAEAFGSRLEAVLEHPERALDNDDRVVVIATIRHMEDFPLDEALAPLIRPLLAWAMQTEAVTVVACSAMVPAEENADPESFPTRLAITYYMLELVALSVEFPDRDPASDAVQLTAIEKGVRAYLSARDRIGRTPEMEALATRLLRGELASWYAEGGGCTSSARSAPTP
jgi:hypothetical protein